MVVTESPPVFGPGGLFYLPPLSHPLCNVIKVADQLFWAKVDQTGGESACWPWGGAIDRYGYGRVQRDHRETGPHRVAWMLMVGPIADDLVIDHLCRERLCCNPAHMEPVTPGENVRRGNAGAALRLRSLRRTCKNGHEYVPGSWYWRSNGQYRWRVCRPCGTARQHQLQLRQRRVN